jgi:putative flippase GtrA
VNTTTPAPRWHGWLRFVLGGALNTGLTYGLYLLLHQRLPYQVAYALAYVAGIVFAYGFNARFVFRVPLSWRGLFAYPLVYLVQYLASAVLLELLVTGMTMPAVFAPLLVSAVMLPLTFVMSRWVLRWSRRRVD